MLSSLFLFFFFLFQDFSLQEIETEKNQFLLDQAAFLAAKKLPNLQLAKSAARLFIEKHVTGDSVLQIQNRDGVLQLELQVRAGGIFQLSSSVVSTLKPEISRQRQIPIFSTRVASRVAQNPKNIALLLDASSYLAPEINVVSQGASHEELDRVLWRESGTGNDTIWPVSRYFQNLADQHLLRGAEMSLHPALATQQCFNPPFLALKKTAQKLYEYFSANPLHQVAVFSGPRVEVAGHELFQTQ